MTNPTNSVKEAMTITCNCGPNTMCLYCIDSKKAPSPKLTRFANLGASPTPAAPAKVGTVIEARPTTTTVANGRGGITTVRNRPATTVRPASDKAMAFLRSLLETKAGDEECERIRAELNEFRIAGMLNPTRVSVAIDQLKAIRKAAIAPVEIEDGFYEMAGIVYKVQRSLASGNLYGKRLNPDTGSFEYEASVPRKLVQGGGVLLTLDRAKHLGHLYGVCCICARTLTNEDSIAAGIGPVCSTKF